MANTFNQFFSADNPRTELESTFKFALKEQVNGPKITLPSDCSYRISADQDEGSHEAGYDALMTGVAFAHFAQKLKFLDKVGCDPKDAIPIQKFTANKVPLGGARLPFNFEEAKDEYVEKGEQIYLCSIKEYGSPLKPSEYVKVFERMFGEVVANLVFGDQVQFYFTFKDEKNCKKLQKELLHFGGSKICNPQSCRHAPR
jgi:hypothetical protein